MDESGKLIDQIMLYKNVRVKTYKLADKIIFLLELLYFKMLRNLKNKISNRTLMVLLIFL